MARLPRVVLPGLPHHVTQRGNRRQPIFFSDDDYALYRNLLAERCQDNGVKVLAYCLMPNHVHLIMVPETADGLARAVGEAHRRYTAFINARLQVTGHLFQARFHSVAMDDAHLFAAIRYVAMNPVKAGLSSTAEDWPWASTRAQLEGRDDALMSAATIRDRIADFAAFLATAPQAELVNHLQSGQTIGRPLMTDDRLQHYETQLGRRLRPLPRGRRATRVNQTLIEER